MVGVRLSKSLTVKALADNTPTLTFYKLIRMILCSKLKVVLVPEGLVEIAIAPEATLQEHHLTRLFRRQIYLRRRKRCLKH